MTHTLKRKLVIVLAMMMTLALNPFTAISSDMWAETPDLNDNSELSSTVIKAAVFVNSRPLVDMWAETPDLNSDTGNYDFIRVDDARIVGSFNSNMYAETPAIDESFHKRRLSGNEDTLLAEGK